jgi:hypothetical protein
VLSCKDHINTPFAVINADDFYGHQAFQSLSDYLRQSKDQDGVYNYSMVGYKLKNTLSEYGSVARGICQVTDEGFLLGVQERTRIEKKGETIQFTENGTDWQTLPEDSIVSMNMWGFTPSFMNELDARFPVFLQKNTGNMEKTEFFLPSVVNELLQEGKAQVKVLPVNEKWYGVTYTQDRPFVQNAIREMVQLGLYPQTLWA